MIPSTYAARVLELHGQPGIEWLQELPQILDYCCQIWSLKLEQPFPNLSYNYVAPAIRSDGLGTVLKAGVLKDGGPDRELVTEHDALIQFGGKGMVRLLEADLSKGVLLLERLIPGNPLREIDDSEETAVIAAGVMRQLWRTVPEDHRFPTTEDWAAGFKRLRSRFTDGYGPFPKRLVEKVSFLFSELLDSSDSQVLLHGDLHHENILRGDRQRWLAIDPKGLIGEPAYETGSFLRNIADMRDETRLKRQLDRTIDIFSEQLDLDKQRIFKWGFAQAVLSAWWSYEDNEQEWQPTLAWTKLFEQLH